MKNLFKNPKAPLITCIISIFVLVIALFALIFTYANAEANLSRQQRWTSDKDSFDRAFEIAALDKETPEKTLYIPNLVEQLGKTVDQAVNDIGNGATVVSSTSEQTVINLNNESGNEKAGTPNIVAYTNRSHKITKISFTCNALLLGYGNTSFVDMINNEHIVEKSFTEGGLGIPEGKVTAPSDRMSYTTFDSNGTTVVMENCDFNGYQWQKGRSYKWSANLNFDYRIANEKGDWSETIRLITLIIS